jgi:hypothetical protein
MNKIARVGNHRTLWLPQIATRETVLLDHPLAVQDVASFQQAIRQFIAVHATDDVRLELLNCLRSVAMPPKRDVQKYLSRLRDNIWIKRNQNASRYVRNTARADLFRFSGMQKKVCRS